MNKTSKHLKSMFTFPITSPYEIIYRNGRIDYPVEPHSHDAVELYFTLSDLPDVLLNDSISAVPAGSLIVIPPFCVHQLYHEAGKAYERYILTINNQWLDNVFCHKEFLFSYLKKENTPLILTPSVSQQKEWVDRLTELLSYPTYFTPEAMASFFHLLSALNQIVNQLSPNSLQPFPVSSALTKINEIITYIQEHIYDNLAVSDLASHFHLNPDYLSRLFKIHAHISVSHYITLQKINTAQSLLREGYTVTQVQEKLGYSSYAYFFKAFQKNTGLSPSKYREQYLGH